LLKETWFTDQSLTPTFLNFFYGPLLFLAVIDLTLGGNIKFDKLLKCLKKFDRPGYSPYILSLPPQYIVVVIIKLGFGNPTEWGKTTYGICSPDHWYRIGFSRKKDDK
jgi:hypothetical protein